MADFKVSGQALSVESNITTQATPRESSYHHANRPLLYITRSSSDEPEYLQRTSSNSKVARFCKSLPFSHSHLLRNWNFELIACITLVAAFVALCITLRIYAHKPSPNWPTWISLNTVVAIYITLLKACLLVVAAEGLGQLKWHWIANERPRTCMDLVRYDNATRGPFGALDLLLQLKSSHMLSSLGAIITILAVIVDPFAQQIVHYYACDVAMPLVAAPSIPRLNYFSGYIELTDWNLAMIAGLLEPDVNPAFNCPTGNCTWPEEYSSVALCSTCTDRSDELSFTNQTVSWPARNLTGFNITTSLPGANLSISVNSEFGGERAIITFPYDGNSYRNPLAPFQTLSANIGFVLSKAPRNLVGLSDLHLICNGTSASQSLWPCQGYGAAQCSLFPCVKTYSASVQNGFLNEVLLDVASNFSSVILPTTNYPTDPAMVDTHCINPEERQSLLDLGYQIDSRWLPYNLTFKLDAPLNATFPQSMMLRNCIYALDHAYLEDLLYYFGSSMSGVVSDTQIDYPMLFSNEQTGGPESVQLMYNFGNTSFERVDDLLTNLSLSLTNLMRENGDSNHNIPVLGIAQQGKTCIRIEWPWLAFPGTVVVLTLVFFTILVFRTRPVSSRPQIWKSSLLPLLYHRSSRKDGVESSTGDDRDRGYDLMAMTARAMSKRITLNQLVPDQTHLDIP